MEEQLISFETAKLAKEKGFNYINVDRYYDLELNNNLTRSFVSIQNKKCLLAPTQSLLQRWLREIHNIYVESYHDLTSDGTKIQFYTSWGFLQQKDKNGNKNVNGWYDEYNDWKTYEEALEIGLQEALKLI